MELLSIDLGLDRASDVPLGTQLAWKLRGAIVGQRLRPRDRLPGVRELAEAAGVNVNTVRAVYARLAEQGLLVTEHGRGTFVTERAAELAELRELAKRAASDARSRGVDPRDLAALLYSEPGPALDDGPRTRRSLRAQIAALDQELAELERELGVAPPLQPAGPEARKRPGARMLTAAQLEEERTGLADRVAARRHELAAERRDAEPAPVPAAEPPAVEAPAWPELLASRPAWLPSG